MLGVEEREVPLSPQVEKYPLSIHAEPSVCRVRVERKVAEVLSHEKFTGLNADGVLEGFKAHHDFTDSVYTPEERARRHGMRWADLFYHGRPHISQTTFDAASITLFLLRYNDAIGKHLSPEGILGGILTSLYHDIGYVYPKKPGESCAARAPIHVETSKDVVVDKLIKIGGFPGLDTEKMSKLAVVGIHGTHFPYDDKRRKVGEELIRKLPEEYWMEAEIVLKILQLADLGGQTARKDQFNTGLKMLRREMNSDKKNLGTEIIGSDRELNDKRFSFVKNVVIPTVGEIAAEFFGSFDNPHQRAWTSGMNLNPTKIPHQIGEG